jgi:iron(II)-dependent oxidoreductase
MIAQHEQQHDETMLATHQLRAGVAVLTAAPAPAARVAVGDEVVIPAGEFTMGTSSDPWALDNERPEHRVQLPGFAIDAAPVTNAQYLAFIDDGGYHRPELWSERGWAHRVEADLTAPQFWERDSDNRWWRRVFGTLSPVRPQQPVVHVCWFEAEAYANWAGKRLATEAVWEKAARLDPATGRSRRYPWGDAEPDETTANLGQRHLEPADVGAYPAGASPSGVHQLIGDVWEWTASGFEPYPGFAAFPYREYSEVFFGGDYRVLRGGSFGTDPVACRSTFRNWDHPIRRQIFSGFRLARDLRPDER